MSGIYQDVGDFGVGLCREFILKAYYVVYNYITYLLSLCYLCYLYFTYDYIGGNLLF